MFIFLIASLTALPKEAWAAPTALKLDPPSVIDETLTPGKTVVMTVQVTDVQNLYAYEFKIYFNNTVLNATKAVRPAGHFLEPSDPANQFVPKWEVKNNFNETHGRIWGSFTLLAPETSRSGNGVLAEINFTILNVGTTVLAFGDTLLADDAGGSIVHDDVNGFFSNSPAPPPPPPPISAHVYISPPDITDPMLAPSTNFTIHINILNATDVYSFELRLTYDPAILEAFDLQEGSFLRNTNLTFSVITINNTEGFATLNSTLTNLPAVSGDGDLATMSFNVLETGATPLTISEFILRNSTGQALGVTVTNGHFSNIGFEGDVNGDGIVDIRDLSAAATAFGATPDDPRWNPGADLNSDGLVNVIDLVIVMMNFGSVIPEYPELILPLVLMVASTMLAMALFRKKHVEH